MATGRVITRPQMEDQYKHAMRQRKQKVGETAITFKHAANDFGLVNQIEMTEQMKSWRLLRKSGKIKIEEYNNKTQVIEDINTTLNGKKWYILVVQPTDENENIAVDPFGLMILGYMVSCYIYAFDKEVNRDAVYKYVMGIKN